METHAEGQRINDMRQTSRAQYHAAIPRRILGTPRPPPLVFHFVLPSLDLAQRPRPLAPAQVLLHRLQRGMRHAVPWLGGVLLCVVCLAGLYWLFASLSTWQPVETAREVVEKAPPAPSASSSALAGSATVLDTVVRGCIGVGIVMSLVGFTGYVGLLIENPFSTILSGASGFFSAAGILGGAIMLFGSLWLGLR